ncbi:MAG: ExbD/TolR family protein [Pyrinomonadaceae bacterium]
MAMSSGGGPGSLQSEINVTPMVDVMLVMLIIFMVITPLLQQGISVAIPRETKNPDEDPSIIKESAVVISIPSNGQFYLRKDRVEKAELKDKIESLMQAKVGEDRIVYVKSGVGVQYGEVVDVIDAVRKAGIDQIGLVADKKKGTAPASATPSTVAQ